MTGLPLFVDADDTLWENNVFFERAFDRFAGYLAHSTLSSAGVRAELDEIEHVNNRLHGYGSKNFARNLKQCFEKLCARPVSDGDFAFIDEIEHDLLHHPMELIEGVEETLAYLNERHHLTLCTKGAPAEQRAKLERSGLTSFFHHVEIVKEKDVALYQRLGAGKPQAWMVGNSPKSDINPALAAGLSAVYIPHAHTWHLEHEDVPHGHEKLVVIDRFERLREVF
ncbi:MAG: HAD hydrolase-like protein [Acidobacteria bacterium]|nr:HAD hydrolase-like protein [Acidobacteriota bacterium]